MNNTYHDLLVEWSMTECAQEIIGKFNESQDLALLDFSNWLDERNCPECGGWGSVCRKLNLKIGCSACDKESAMDETKLREMATKWICPNGFATTPYEFGAINNLMNFGRAVLAVEKLLSELSEQETSPELITK